MEVDRDGTEIKKSIQRSKDKKDKFRLSSNSYPFPKFLLGNKVLYFHIRNTYRTSQRNTQYGGVTVSILHIKRGVYHVGVSICSILDNFSRAKGRHYASNRLMSSMEGHMDMKHCVPFFLKYDDVNWTIKGIVSDVIAKIYQNYWKIEGVSLL